MTQLSTGLYADPTIPVVPVSHLAGTVDGMIDALESERRLIEELIALMRQQREAVARDDLQSVDDSVYSVQRVLLTLGEARKRRRTLNRRMGRPEDAPLRDLDDVLGALVTPALRQARERLQLAARTLSQEVTVNRRVLREALAAGDDYVRQLYGGAEPRPLYGESAAPTDALSGGVLLDRRA